MASGFYENGVNSIMSADVDLRNDDISALLIDTNSYTVDLNNHSDLTDITEAAILKEISLSGKTLEKTVFRANDITFESVTGNNADAVIIFKNAESDAECILIAYLDNAPEFPITPDGSDVIIKWDTGSNGIFKQ